MTKHFIDKGDRVVIVDTKNNTNGFGSSSLKPIDLGEHGVVIYNNGFGNCTVLLDNGREVNCWNGANLDWETNVKPT